MNKFATSLIAGVGICGLIATSFAPVSAQAATKKVIPKKKTTYHIAISVSAIPAADERDFANAKSRCLTRFMKNKQAVAVKQMNADVTKYGQDHDAAVTIYKQKLDLLWSAMEQPYCGYGGYGMQAVQHSYDKSVERIRAEFLVAAK